MARKTAFEQQLEELEKLRKKETINNDEYQARRSAIIAAAPATDDKKGRRGGGIFKWGMFGCLGMLGAIGGLVVVIVVIIAIAANNAADKTKDSGGDVHVALAEGASGVISPDGNGSKKSQVKVLKIVDNAEANLAAPPAGKKYWAVQVEVQDVGTKEVTSLDWKLRDSTDAESDRTFFSGIGENLDVAYNLTPGGKTTGWVVFAIDKDAQPKWLRADPNPFLADDLYFDAR